MVQKSCIGCYVFGSIDLHDDIVFQCEEFERSPLFCPGKLEGVECLTDPEQFTLVRQLLASEMDRCSSLAAAPKVCSSEYCRVSGVLLAPSELLPSLDKMPHGGCCPQTQHDCSWKKQQAVIMCGLKFGENKVNWETKSYFIVTQNIYYTSESIKTLTYICFLLTPIVWLPIS